MNNRPVPDKKCGRGVKFLLTLPLTNLICLPDASCFELPGGPSIIICCSLNNKSFP